MKGGDHHYSIACFRLCANAPYLVSLTFSLLVFCLSFLFIRLHWTNVTFTKLTAGCRSPSSSLSLSALPCFWILLRLHSYSYCRWLCDGPPWTLLNGKFCLRTRTNQPSQTKTISRRPNSLTSLPRSICCQIPFHFSTDCKTDPFCSLDATLALSIGASVHTSQR